MSLDADALGELLRKERASTSLQPVESGFYRDLARLLVEVKERYPPYSRERENLSKLVEELFNVREKKLLLQALFYARSQEPPEPESTTPEERDFILKLVEMLRARRERLLRSVEEGDGKEECEVAGVGELPSSKPRMVAVRILQDLPPIVGSDGRTYGSFKPEDVVLLPERNAAVFVKHGYGVVIEHKA